MPKHTASGFKLGFCLLLDLLESQVRGISMSACGRRCPLKFAAVIVITCQFDLQLWMLKHIQLPKPQKYASNSHPKPPIVAIKAIILHTFGVQVGVLRRRKIMQILLHTSPTKEDVPKQLRVFTKAFQNLFGTEACTSFASPNSPTTNLNM